MATDPLHRLAADRAVRQVATGQSGTWVQLRRRVIVGALAEAAAATVDWNRRHTPAVAEADVVALLRSVAATARN